MLVALEEIPWEQVRLTQECQQRLGTAAPCPGTFFRNEQLSVAALQEGLSEQVSLNSGFLLQVEVADTQSLQHLSGCLRTKSSQRLCAERCWCHSFLWSTCAL